MSKDHVVENVVCLNGDCYALKENRCEGLDKYQ